MGIMYSVKRRDSSRIEGKRSVCSRAATQLGISRVETAVITSMTTWQEFYAIMPPVDEEEPKENVEPMMWARLPETTTEPCRGYRGSPYGRWRLFSSA